VSTFDAFRYDGKRVVVVGGATGIGAAAARLAQDAGAEVVVMDFAEVTLPGVKAIRMNLAERASIDAAVDECGGVVHALFCCAGVADIRRAVNLAREQRLLPAIRGGGINIAGSASLLSTANSCTVAVTNAKAPTPLLAGSGRSGNTGKGPASRAPSVPGNGRTSLYVQTYGNTRITMLVGPIPPNPLDLWQQSSAAQAVSPAFSQATIAPRR